MNSNMDIAVIGMSCRFPDADNIDEFWSNLISGKNSIRSKPKERWFMSGQGDLVAGYLKCPVDEFDANFFNISPKEATYIDPQHRLFLEVSWESLEHAGIPPTSLNGTNTGVYLGIGSDEYFRTQLDSSEDTVYKIVGNSISAATGRLSFFLNLLGPSIPIEATCASSAVAVHLACADLRLGQCSLAIAGGVNVLVDVNSTYPSALISPSCRSFDVSASGFAPAEGCGVIVLKLLKDALRDRNDIIGVIRGSYLKHTGKSTSYGTPSVNSEELVIRESLKAAGIDPLDVSYVEAHAGGTAIGDPIEVKAISNVFGSKFRVTPLVLGSFKTNIGHPMAAAGVAGIIKMLLCLKNGVIPGNLHQSQLHPDINLDVIPAVIPTEAVSWTSSRQLIGAINCFGITGTNVHIVIQQPPRATAVAKDLNHQEFPVAKLNLLTISAKDEIALEKLRSKYQEALEQESESLDLANFTFSANTTRSHLSHRIALLGSTCANMSQKLSTLDYFAGIVPGMHQPIIFLFTGHGCQYFGMARDLYETNHIFKEAFDSCSSVYQNNLGISLETFIWGEGTGINLNRTKYSQPAIFAIEYCLFILWTELGIRPDYVLGHSIGEFAACVASGILSFEDGMKLVCCRSILIDELPEGRMIAVGAAIARVRELIKNFLDANPTEWIDVACMNSVEQTVISATLETAPKFKQFLDEQQPGVKSKVLPSLHAFHSQSMDPILDEFERIASEVDVREPTCKYVSGLLNRELEPHEINANYWKNHCRQMVSFSRAIDSLLQKGAKVFVEVSPQPILLNFLMANNINGSEIVTCPTLRNGQGCWTTILESLAKIYVSTNSKINFQILNPAGQRVYLPHYTFNRKKCWAAPNSNRCGRLGGATHEQNFHSLLGWKLNLAMSSETRFYNYLSSHSTGYIQDHTIVDHVIVPAACYLEMLLTLARKEYGIKYPVIENLQVLRACVLDDSMKQIQTKAAYEGANLEVNFYSESEEGEWLEHVRATLNLESSPSSIPPPLQQSDIEKIKAECCNEIDTDEMYTRLDTSGIQMGPLFRSARKLHISPDKTGMLGSLKCVKTKEGEFSFHPIGIDALVQCFWEYKMCRLEEVPFALPVGINKFIWYGEDNAHLPEDVYFHIRDEDHGYVFTVEGQIIAEIEVLTVLHSSQVAFLRSITPGEKLPQFISKDWVPLEVAKLTNDTDLLPNGSQILTEDEISQAIKLITQHHQDRLAAEKSYEKLTYLYILKALLELGWAPIKDAIVGAESIQIPQPMTSLDMRFKANLLDILAQEGLLSKTGAEEWKILMALPSLDTIREELAELEKNSQQEPSDFAYVKHLGDSLLPVMRGKFDPLEVLQSRYSRFTTVKSEEPRRMQADIQLLATVFENVFNKYTEAFRGKKLRILQIGATSTSATKAVIEVLQKLEVKFEFVVSDTRASIQAVTEDFGKINVTIKVLDIERDPKPQGFCPGYYDVIIAVQSLHATEDLRATLDNVRHLLAPNGLLFLCELAKQYRDFAISYALLKNYWKLKESRGFVVADPEIWVDLLDQSGFTDTLSLTVPESNRVLFVSRAESGIRLYRPFQPTLCQSDPAWLIFGTERNDLSQKLGEKLKQAGRNAFYILEGQRFDKANDEFSVNPTRASDFQQLSHVLKNYEIEGIIYMWGMAAQQTELSATHELKKAQSIMTSGLLNVIKIKVDNNWMSKIFLVTSGAEEVNPAQGTLWGMLDTYFNEYPEATGLGIDIAGPATEDSAAAFIFSVLWDTPNERGICFENGGAKISRLHAYDSALPLDEVLLPKSNKFKLIEPTTFTFGNIELSADVDHLEVAVRAVGLNFRDLLLTTGLLETTHPDSVGLEFAGIVTNADNSNRFAIGDRVAGLTCSGALASHVSFENPQLIFPIPSEMSYAGAATLPVAYGTLYLALVEIANIQPGEKLLIHTASGGVGLAGIHLARHFGADVYVTAGTPKKRKYLRESVGVEYVYNSRSHEYRDDILRDTQGSGVNIIINTITGPGFKEASLECLAKNGRFIELSKLNVWREEEVNQLRPDVDYTILDAFDMIINSHPSLSTSLSQLANLFKTKKLDILPYSYYPLSQLKSAFKYFHQHNHIGKVVVEIPETPDKYSSVTLYNPQSTYMVTGGIGGLGFEVGRYLWENGGNVLLVGRSLPNEEIQLKLDSFGNRMRYVQCDVGDYDKCKELIDGILPPLRGIFHCAGLFANGFLVGQSSENYAKSFQSKVYGTWNLHLLTQNKHLDHFVIFSSVASVLGSTGLSNYSAANRYLDSLMHYRVNQCGLPGLTIDWGPWAEVGAAAGYVTGMFKNFHHFTPELGLQSMERAMRLRLNDVAIADMDMNIILSSPRLAPYLSELNVDAGRGKRRVKGDFGMNRPCDIKLTSLAKDVLAAADVECRLEKMEIFVEAIFKTQSGLGESDVVDKDQALTLMGMDSLIGMEMRLRISKLLDVQIPANGVMEHNSIRMFSAYLAGLLPALASNSDQENGPEIPASEIDEIRNLGPPIPDIPKSDSKGKVENNNEIEANSSFLKIEKPVKLVKSNKGSLPKFVAKRLQKFHKNSEKKASNTEKQHNGNGTT